MDLDQLRLKTSDELNDDEKTFLKENVDKLTDEDKDAYSSFLETPPVTPAEGEGEAPATPTEGEGEAAPVVEDPKPGETGYVFKTEEEAKAFVEKIQKETIAADRKAAIDAAATPAEKKYVEENWKPKDWNEGLDKASDIALEKLEAKQKKDADDKETQRKAFEAEWDGIVATNKLPARTTEEGQKVLKAVFDIGVKYGQPNFAKSFELYSQLPAALGGGYDSADAKKKADGDARRAAAAKIAGNTPAGDKKSGTAPKSYQDLHGKSESSLIRDAVKATA